jgi:hypothetical protein
MANDPARYERAAVIACYWAERRPYNNAIIREEE